MGSEAVVVEQASWIVANWEAVSLIVAGVVALLTGGKAVTLWRALKLVIEQEQSCAEPTESKSPGVAGAIRNMKARVDPDPKKQPKLRDALKGVAVDAVAGAIGKLFRRGKK